MPLPTLKATFNESYFRPYGWDFWNTFSELFMYFKDAQETGDNTPCVTKLNEIFGDDQEKFQIFFSQASTFLAHKSIETDEFSNEMQTRIDVEGKLSLARANLSKLNICVTQEKEKLGKIEAKGTSGWYGKWKHKRAVGTIEILEQKKNNVVEYINDLLGTRSLCGAENIYLDYDARTKKIKVNENYLKFADFLCDVTDQKLQTYITSVRNKKNTPDVNKNKNLLLQSCVCAQATRKIAAQNFTESAIQFNKSMDLLVSKRHLFESTKCFHDVTKVNPKVVYSDASVRDKWTAAVVLNKSKITRVVVFVETAVQHVVNKMKSMPYNNSLRGLKHPSHTNGALTAGAEPLTQYLNSAKCGLAMHTETQLDTN